jgi:hypothetical protein
MISNVPLSDVTCSCSSNCCNAFGIGKVPLASTIIYKCHDVPPQVAVKFAISYVQLQDLYVPTRR